MAAVWFKGRVENAFGNYYKYYRLFYSCVAAVSLILLLIYQFSHESPILYKRSWLVLCISFPLLIAGLTIMIVCIRKYFLNLSGVDVLLKDKHEPVLETGGLHRYVRHPLYSGTLLFIWALFLLLPLTSNLIACMVITIYTLIGIRMEEQKLRKEFGDAYKLYASSIPMLVPSLKGKRSY
jgi:protein-S-isoprenylcysteine O-methyltransferase Ste14